MDLGDAERALAERLRALKDEFEQVLGLATRLRDGTQDLEAHLVGHRIPALEEPDDTDEDDLEWPPPASELAACEIVDLSEGASAYLALAAPDPPSVLSDDVAPPIDAIAAPTDYALEDIVTIEIDSGAFDIDKAFGHERAVPTAAIAGPAATDRALATGLTRGSEAFIRPSRDRRLLRAALAFGLGGSVLAYVDARLGVRPNPSQTGSIPRIAKSAGPVTPESTSDLLALVRGEIGLVQRPQPSFGSSAVSSRHVDEKAARPGGTPVRAPRVRSALQRAVVPASVAPPPPASPPPALPSREPGTEAVATIAGLPAGVYTPASPAPVVVPSANSTAPATDNEEERIRSTLLRFRTAYGQLNASAARAVWPSIDEPALTRAFGDLMSQDLRFDRCDLSVKGAEAFADCRGQATYVRRVGSRAPRTAQREWKFNLKKRDESWTIASAQIR